MSDFECPFCGFKAARTYDIQLHIEEHHTDDSPFAVTNNDASGLVPEATTENAISGDESMPQDTWTKCTRPGCGEYVLLADIDEHLEVHEAIDASEKAAQEDEKTNRSQHVQRDRYPRRRESRSDDSQRSPRKLQKAHFSENAGYQSGHILSKYFYGTSYKGQSQGRLPPPPPRSRRPIREPREPGRLGRRELGPHAFEDAMPTHVRRRLLNDALPRHENRIGRDGRLYRDTYFENETAGLIPILADLCALDRSTEVTYLCDPSVRHITKIHCDGNFCGYWNIQVLLSYHYSKARSPPNRERSGEPEVLPNVLQIQDTIEQAWDNGICSYGRIETGGVRNTRKWIGTHEALAFFTQAGIKVEALVFRKDENEGNDNHQPSFLDLLDHIEAYFISDFEGSKKIGSSYITSLPPIYLQRFGHSLTIVGLERKEDGDRNLLVFDSSFETSNGMRRALDGRDSRVMPETLLKAYRRSELSLSRWEEFEIIV